MDTEVLTVMLPPHEQLKRVFVFSRFLFLGWGGVGWGSVGVFVLRLECVFMMRFHSFVGFIASLQRALRLTNRAFFARARFGRLARATYKREGGMYDTLGHHVACRVDLAWT